MKKQLFLGFSLFSSLLACNCDNSLLGDHCIVCEPHCIILGDHSAPCCKKEIDKFSVSNLVDDGDIVDKNISTLKVGIKKTLYLYDIDENDDSKTKDFNGTVCYRVVDENNDSLVYLPWQKEQFDESNYTKIDVTIDNNITKQALFNIKWKKDTSSDDTNCNDSLDGETNSTDDFAIIPVNYKFEIPFP